MIGLCENNDCRKLQYIQDFWSGECREVCTTTGKVRELAWFTLGKEICCWVEIEAETDKSHMVIASLKDGSVCRYELEGEIDGNIAILDNSHILYKTKQDEYDYPILPIKTWYIVDPQGKVEYKQIETNVVAQTILGEEQHVMLFDVYEDEKRSGLYLVSFTSD